MGKLLIPFYILVIIGKALLKNKVLLVLVVIIAVIAIGVGSYTNATKKSEVGKVEIPSYQATAPAKSIAPQIAVTQSRIYYVTASRAEGDWLILTDYYTYNKTWEHKTGELRLLRSKVQLVVR